MTYIDLILTITAVFTTQVLVAYLLIRLGLAVLNVEGEKIVPFREDGEHKKQRKKGKCTKCKRKTDDAKRAMAMIEYLKGELAHTIDQVNHVNMNKLKLNYAIKGGNEGAITSRQLRVFQVTQAACENIAAQYHVVKDQNDTLKNVINELKEEGTEERVAYVSKIRILENKLCRTEDLLKRLIAGVGSKIKGPRFGSSTEELANIKDYEWNLVVGRLLEALEREFAEIRKEAEQATNKSVRAQERCVAAELEKEKDKKVAEDAMKRVEETEKLSQQKSAHDQEMLDAVLAAAMDLEEENGQLQIVIAEREEILQLLRSNIGILLDHIAMASNDAE